MRSLQSKFVILILSVVMLCTMVIGGAGISSASDVLDRDAAKIMNLTCHQQAEMLDVLFSEISVSVDVVAKYAQSRVESMERLQNDEEYRAAFAKDVCDLFFDAIGEIDDTVAYFVRFNPEYTSPTAGLYYRRAPEKDGFVLVPTTDLSAYDPEKTHEVDWYYTPVNKGAPVWMTPYWDKNLETYLISYIVPVYAGEQLMGVVGMDVEFGAIQDMVNEISLYDTGYAFLTDEKGNITTHKTIQIGASLEEMDASLAVIGEYLEADRSGDVLYEYVSHGTEKKLAFVTLQNDMKLILTVPTAELEVEKTELRFIIFVCALVISILFIIISVAQMQKMIDPLKKLTEAAERIAQGDMNIDLHCNTNDELEVLTESFQKTAEQLKRNMDYINSLAYVDALTGIKNQTAYQETIRQLEREMAEGDAAYAVVVLDVNGLKAVNDKYGHEYGDMLLKNACRLVCNVFAHSPVFRIGGDEFAVIMRTMDYERRDLLMEELVIVMADIMENGKEPWDRVSMAKGMACYDARVDKEFHQVFQRADKAMYENKVAMKNKMGIETRV